MIVIINANQLRPIVERAIVSTLNLEPENLRFDPRFLNRNEQNWKVSAEFDCDGSHHTIEITLDPKSGKVRELRFSGGISTVRWTS